MVVEEVFADKFRTLDIYIGRSCSSGCWDTTHSSPRNCCHSSWSVCTQLLATPAALVAAVGSPRDGTWWSAATAFSRPTW